MEQDMDARLTAMATRVGALEMLVETLLAGAIAGSVKFAAEIEDLYPESGITDHLDQAQDDAMRRRLLLIDASLRDRIRAARQQSLRFDRKGSRGGPPRSRAR